jgi:hypothetical protein
MAPHLAPMRLEPTQVISVTWPALFSGYRALQSMSRVAEKLSIAKSQMYKVAARRSLDNVNSAFGGPAASPSRPLLS